MVTRTKLGWDQPWGRVAMTARRFAADTSAGTAIEYALMTFIAIAILVAMGQFSGALNAMFARLTALFGG